MRDLTQPHVKNIKAVLRTASEVASEVISEMILTERSGVSPKRTTITLLMMTLIPLMVVLSSLESDATPTSLSLSSQSSSPPSSSPPRLLSQITTCATGSQSTREVSRWVSSLISEALNARADVESARPRWRTPWWTTANAGASPVGSLMIDCPEDMLV